MGVSYSFLRILEEDGTNLPAGWLLSFSGRVTPLLSAVGEIGGNYKSESGMTVKLHTFQDASACHLARTPPSVRTRGSWSAA